MTIGLHNLKMNRGFRKRSRRVGRGNSSGRGNYSGRGIKGQRARAGGKRSYAGKKYPSLIRMIPKIKGFQSIHPKKESVNLDDLNVHFGEGEIVTPRKLAEKGLIRDWRKGTKILGQGKLNKKLIVKAEMFSKKAQTIIEKEGGEIEIINQKK